VVAGKQESDREARAEVTERIGTGEDAEAQAALLAGEQLRDDGLLQRLLDR